MNFILGINEYHIDLGFKFFILVLGCSFLVNYFWSKNSGKYVLKKYFKENELNLKKVCVCLLTVQYIIPFSFCFNTMG